MLEDLHRISLSESKFSFLLGDSDSTFPPFSRHDDRTRGGTSHSSTQTCSRCSVTISTITSGLRGDGGSDGQPDDQSVLETLNSAEPQDLEEKKKKALRRAMEEHKSVCGTPFRGYTAAQGQILEVLEKRWKAAEGKEKSDEMRLGACKDQLSKLVQTNFYAKSKAFTELEGCFYESKDSGETWEAVIWVFDHTCEDRIGWDRPRDICDTCSRYVVLPRDWATRV